MSQTYSESVSHTYTSVDVGKVLDCFAADLDGFGQSTGLLTREQTQDFAADVKLMAQRGYLSEVNVYLRDAMGSTIRATKYEVSIGATLTASRPANYLWPRTPGGQLCVHVTYNATWSQLTDAQRLAFKLTLRLTWGSVHVDTSFPMLRRSGDRTYASNGYALQKSVFS